MKETAIRLGVFTLAVCLMIYGADMFGQYWKEIMFCIAGWQVGGWSATLGCYLVERFNGK